MKKLGTVLTIVLFIAAVTLSFFVVDGKSYRTFVLEHYGKSKLTAKLVDKFREDVANGKIKL